VNLPTKSGKTRLATLSAVQLNKEAVMFDTNKKLEVSQEQLKIIEDALHTQSKILHVQADAGGSGAHARLNEVKTILAMLAQHAPAPEKAINARQLSWFSLTRSMP
jgi:hypothetical protein